jgi:hemerythrin-like domain-containing protein
MKTGDTSAAMDVVHNVLDYVNLLREHIIKEDNVLFPMADQVVTGDDMHEVSRKFEQALAEDETSGEIKRCQELALKLSEALSKVA